MRNALQIDFQHLILPIDKESFYLKLLLDLNATMEEVIGVEESRAFTNIITDRVATFYQSCYKNVIDQTTLTTEQIAYMLIDIYRRLGGSFTIQEFTPNKIVFANTYCPFGDSVKNHKSMCALTTNLFGKITADNLGYAGIDLEKAIAAGDDECRVVVYLEPKPNYSGNLSEFFTKNR